MDTSLLQMALIGYAVEREKIMQKIAEIQKRLGGQTQSSAARRDGGGGDIPTPLGRKRRKMSAAARKRIAAAQKKRWAAFRKKQKAA